MITNWESKSECAVEVEQNSRLSTAWISQGLNSWQARQVCVRKCPVRTECLLSALLDDEAEGFRGGFFFQHGIVQGSDAMKILEEFGLVAYTSKKQRAVARRVA